MAVSYWLSIPGLAGSESNRQGLLQIPQERMNSGDSGLVEGAVMRFIFHDEEHRAGYIFSNVLGVSKADSGVQRTMDYQGGYLQIERRRNVQMRAVPGVVVKTDRPVEAGIGCPNDLVIPFPINLRADDTFRK